MCNNLWEFHDEWLDTSTHWQSLAYSHSCVHDANFLCEALAHLHLHMVFLFRNQAPFCSLTANTLQESPKCLNPRAATWSLRNAKGCQLNQTSEILLKTGFVRAEHLEAALHFGYVLCAEFKEIMLVVAWMALEGNTAKFWNTDWRSHPGQGELQA